MSSIAIVFYDVAVFCDTAKNPSDLVRARGLTNITTLPCYETPRKPVPALVGS